MFEVTAATAASTIALIIVGGYWSRTPAAFVGVAPLMLVLTAAYSLTQGAYPIVVALLAAAGFIRSRNLGHPKPHSAVFGAVLGVGVSLAASGLTPLLLTLVAASLLPLGDGALDNDRVYTEEVPYPA